MTSMLEALAADGPDATLAAELTLFGQFVGSWDVVTTMLDDDGQVLELRGEWSFGWALGGRAIVDVWNVPGREHGVTVRYYDPRIGQWRVTWSGPRTGRQIMFLATKRGDEIVLEGVEDGLSINWIFSEIEPSSFRWRAVKSHDGGATWELAQEMRLTRTA